MTTIKKCSDCDNTAVKFGKCRTHYNLWMQKVYKKVRANQGTKSNKRKIKRTQKSLEHNKKMFKGFLDVLEQYNYECQECKLMGVPCEYRPEDLQVAHIQSRGANIGNALDKDNQIPLCIKHHDQLDNSTKSGMMIHSKVQDILIKMKQKQNHRDAFRPL